MAEPYWQPGDPSAPAGKRPRPAYDFVPPGGGTQMVIGGQEVSGYLAREDNRAAAHVVKDTRSIMESYDRYLQNGAISTHGSGEPRNIPAAGFGGQGVAGPLTANPVMMFGSGLVLPDIAANSRNMGFNNQPPVDLVARPEREVRLPPDASSTLFIEGLPSDSTQREVAHIFRPFVGYKEVRLVTKNSRNPGGNPVVLCFVDFVNANCAATALGVLHGYKMDEQDQNSPVLRMQFARHPGPRSGSGMGPRSGR
ncbi:RNA-binding protein 2 [Nymphaea thermarum]|nr:RNA-binding protein 2 [Nymphaea thermarum]